LSQATSEPSSKLQRDLVDSGLCINAGVWFPELQRHTSMIELSLQALPDKIDGCATAALAELPKMKDPSFFADEELANAAHRFDVWLAEQQETTAELSHTLTWMWTSASLDYYLGLSDKVHAVTRADVVRLLNTWVLGKPFIFGTMASPKVIGAGLDKAHLERLAGIGGGR
jgi:zinc protease